MPAAHRPEPRAAATPDLDASVDMRAQTARWTWIVALLTVLVGLHRFANGFVMDDEAMIVRNDVIHSLRNVPAIFAHHALFVSGEEREAISTWRPLTLTIFVLDYQITGARPWGYHATNLLAHLAATLLLWRFALRMLAGPAADPRRPAPGTLHAAAVAALFFGLHPASVEAQVWINGRSDVFAALFLLGAALVLTGGAAGGVSRGRAAAAGALFFAGCLCKEVLLLGLPALVWITASRAPEGERLRTALRPAIALGLSAIVYLTLRTIVLEGAAAGTSEDQRAALLHLGVVWLDGVRTLLLPPALGMRVIGADYAAWPAWVFGAGWGVALAAGVVSLRWAHRAPLVFAAVLAGAGFLAPIAVLSAVEWPGFNRYVYLPAPFFALAVAWTWQRVVERGEGAARAARVAMIAWLVVFGMLHALGTLQYRDMRTFLGAIEDASPRARLLDAALGNLAFRDGDCATAHPRLERAVVWEPDHVESLTHLALCQLEHGDLEGASRGLEQALARLPDEGALWNALGRVHFASDLERGTRTLLRCRQVARDPERCAANLARVLDEHPERDRIRAIIDADPLSPHTSTTPGDAPP